jgi:hypothetical protein
MAAGNLGGRRDEELLALEAQNRSLQTLVAELLLTNQQLRLNLARSNAAASGPATHPPPRPDR